jgi:wyosine [tRNA(Phe)-imidazoG37] synthetase (radical SAM superfamily)
LPEAISEMVGDDLPVVAAKRQLCPTISEMTSGKHSNSTLKATNPHPDVRRPNIVCSMQTAFGCPRDFLDNRYVYVVIPPRARGLSIGVNLNPDKKCNFDCAYCEVDRSMPRDPAMLDLDVVADELHRTINYINAGGLSVHPRYAGLSPDLLRPRHVALSGDGEPTLCPQFLDAVQTVAHVRAMGRVPFFKIVLITNSSRLDAPQVQDGLKLFTSEDEVWAKLEAGTQEYMQRVNGTDVPLEKILANILFVSRQRPVVIQSLFPMLDGQPPSSEEIEAFSQRLKALTQSGGHISLVQIYSATRPQAHPRCGHLTLRQLSQIAQAVRAITGLKVEVF